MYPSLPSLLSLSPSPPFLHPFPSSHLFIFFLYPFSLSQAAPHVFLFSLIYSFHSCFIEKMNYNLEKWIWRYHDSHLFFFISPFPSLAHLFLFSSSLPPLSLIYSFPRWFIEKTNSLGYTVLKNEYEEDYRDNARVLVRAPKIAEQLYDRLKYVFFFFFFYIYFFVFIFPFIFLVTLYFHSLFPFHFS